MQLKIKSFNILRILFLLISFNAVAASHAVLIMYHHVGDPRYPSTNVTLQQFDEQLQELKKPKYHVLPIPEIINKLQHHQNLPEHTVGISFDDAYRSVFNNAWPRLKAAGLPFTLFVATKPSNNKYPNMMSWEQIKTLYKAGVSIGNHSYAHPKKVDMKDAAVDADIKHAQNDFKQHLGFYPKLYAYPYGIHTQHLQELIKVHGFIAAFAQFSSVVSDNTDWFSVPRFALNEKYSDINRFKLIINSLPLPVTHVQPVGPDIHDNPPKLSFQVYDHQLSLNKLRCYPAEQAPADVLLQANSEVKIAIKQPLKPGDAKVNCTLPGSNGRWYWFGKYFYLG